MENNIIPKLQKLRSRADRAFGDGKFLKAYDLYSQILTALPEDYDTIACFVGTALNLGYLDDVFSKSDRLIELDAKKAQVAIVVVYFMFFLWFSFLIIIIIIGTLVVYEQTKGVLFKRNCQRYPV